MDVLLLILNFLLQWYIWLPIVIVLAVLTWHNYHRSDEDTEGTESVLLVLEIPKANDKKELAAEQLFASLHGILRDRDELRLNKGFQEHISFEIASVNGQIRFYAWVPKPLRNFVEGQIYSQYPTVQIFEAPEDYVSSETKHDVIYSSEITLTDSQMLPIKTFQSFEVDPLAGITGALAKLESTGDEIWVQILARPIADDWHKASERWIKNVKKNGSGPIVASGAFSLGSDILKALWQPPEGAAGSTATAKEVSERDRTRIAEAEKKATKLGYQVKIRLVYLGENASEAQLKMQAIVGTFKQFNSTNLNGFRMTRTNFGKEKVDDYRKRIFIDEGFILNIEELASVFHLPHTNVETPNVVWANSKNAEPPSKLPIITGDPANDENISAFGLTNFRGINHQFGILRSDRGRHIYIIGQTGSGKTGMLSLLALSDIFYNQGYAIIDPHGDFAVDNMRFIPSGRLHEVIYFNPSDTAFPIGFNPLEITNYSQKNNVCSEVIGVLKRMFGESWGPRMEHILRYTILALLDRPNATMLDITRMLTDKVFRKDTLSYCQDAVVRNFWKSEFDSWNDKFATEAVAPVLNKVGAFTANPIIRNIIGQPKSTFNIREIMDEGKILIVNLSKGLIGEDNAAILGSFLVTKIQLAAMSRSDIERIEDRKPFYLYVDEFQNFATDSFATILSEARKYALNLTVANQYIGQMSETVRDAVFGNVGTMASFRVSADDAPILAKQFEPQFEPTDLLQMHNRHFILNMVIGGEKSQAFNAKTLTLPIPQDDNTGHIIENTRLNYSRTREDVEQEIAEAIKPMNVPSEPPQQRPPSPEQRNHQSQPQSVPQSQPRPQPAIKLPEGIVAFEVTTNTGSVGDKATVIPSPVRTEVKTEASTDEVPKKRRRPRHRKKSNDENSSNESNPQQSSEPRESRSAPVSVRADDNTLRIRR